MIMTDLSQVEPRPRKVAVGEFDGVHVGHRAVIEGSDTVLTFEPHPRAVVGPTGAPLLLTTLEQKREAISRLGVQELVVASFDIEFSRMTAERFVADVLIGALGATEVSVGANFRFGTKATGDADLLRANTTFETKVADIVSGDLGLISSSRIRGFIADGEIEAATAMLGRPFEMWGVVGHGEKRGRELGYPTANLRPQAGCVVPAFGIYACLANGHPAVASLGVRPTFEDEGEVLLEVHLLDFEGDLYGTELRVALLSRLRGEERFDSVDELIAQMDRDSAAAAEACRAHGN